MREPIEWRWAAATYVESFTKMTDAAAGALEVPGSGGAAEVWVNIDDLDRAREVLNRTS